MQKEFESQITTILKEELLARTQKNQQKIKNQISMFVQKHAKNGNYVELPYYLLLSAKKAGFGDLQRQFFTRKNGEMEICYMKSELSSSQMLDAKRTYLTQAREHFTEEEQIWIDRVEKAHQQLENLRNIE